MDDVSIAKDCIDRMDEVFADDPESIDYDLVNNDEDREGEVAYDERVVLEPSEQEARRTLRPSNTSKRLSPAGLLDDREDSADEEVVDGDEEINQEGLQRCIGALKSFFLRRLEDCILSLGGSTEVLKGIKVQVSRISTGVTQGLLEVSYYFNRSKRFRTRVEVACSLGLMVSVKSVRGMTREQHYRIATETREKHLLSQQLSLANYVCEEIQYSDNQIKLCLKSDAAVCTEAVMETTPLRTEASDRSSLYFAFGNVVVLNWGTIYHYPCFHSQHQIYPIGFKCLRQELDITLDRVVDCVCEIIAVYEGSDGQTSPASMASIQANEYPSRDLLPLFRLSIAWQIPTVTSTGCMERTVVRVYEARTPQSAWQAAMLETVGLESLNMNMSYDAAIEDKYDAIEDQSEVMPPFETGDDEELEMRQKIRELRRKYFRMLRAEQSAGTQSAMKPRLNVDSSDGFFEDIVMRLIEGMDESIRCRNYAYCDTRDKGAGRKNMLKGYTKIYQKAKTLDKAIRRHAYVQEQLQLSSSCKRKKGADGSCDYSDLNSSNNNNNNRTSNKRTKLDPKDRTKDMRFMVASALKSRTVRIKDMEKNINLMKFALAKYVKRRREDAKTLAEIVADREESHRSNRNKVSLQQPAGALMDSKAFGPNSERPESIANFVVIDGAVMGQLIEIWEFLHAFSKKLQLSSDVPSIEQLMLAARTCDPRYRAVSSYTGSIHHTYDFVVAHQFVDPLPSDASELLDRIGVALTSQLMPDFDRLLGLDSIGAQGSMLQKVPNNTLTWREIARTVLLTTCCKEVGVSEVDAVSLLRGRGFFTSPETADRKTLKLARRRIKLNYALRNEHQESVIGFSSGLCVHIPAPGMPYPEEGVLWSQLVGSLDQVPDSCGWLVFEIIKAAAFSACVIDTSASAKRLKRSLLSCLAHPSFRVNDGAAAKTAAMRILSEHGKSQASTRKPSISLSSQANSMDHGLVTALAHTKDPHRAVLDQIKLVYDGSPYMIPLSTMDVWRKQLSEAVRHAAVQEVVSAPSTDMEVVRVEDGDVSSVVVVPSVAATTTTERSAQSMDSDAVQADKLSVAMQRCYVVVRDLMTNPQSNAFLWPVDGLQFPEYYRSVPQPLSLSEVRTALVEGLYRDSIFRFYCDVTLVIENAMAFNVENSAVKTAAQKFLLLFERLFFETVLCWDHALPSHDSCHGCRSVVPIEGGSKIAVCDRCDACYHLGCLEPPMFSPPRSEWYCLPCVEQKGIASAHPYRTADVSHPEDPAAKGEVVGIEQIRQTLMFVVEFGGVRELWDGRKLRQFAMEPPAVTGMEDEDRNGADGLCASKSVFSMPTGYDYEDFDRVCGIARAYVGWGASHYLMPSVLMSEHNIAARTKSQDDSLFCQYRQCVATLGPSAGGVQGDELSMHEWGHLLTSLVHRILDATSLTAPLSEMDDKVDDDLVAQIQHGVQTDALPVERVFAMIRGESEAWRNDDNGDDDVDKDILIGSSSKKKPLRVAVDPSAGTMGASKRTTGASSSVADEQLDDDVGSDDEDMHQESDQEEEFDVDMKTVQLADSEEEDELELFDDEGRCLTSSLPTREQQTSPVAFSERSSQEGCAFRPINIQPTSKTSLADIIASPMSMKRRDVEKEWVQRLLSRQKGREDAHLTQLLVLDILTQLDVDGRKELEEEVFRYVGDEELGGDFYSAALGGIVKGCVNKSGDTISAADWYVAWEANLTALQQNANDSITCKICGYDENYVANPFVWGQTAEEWEADLVSNNAHAVITEPQLTGADPSVFPLAQGVSVSVGIKGFKARYRVMKGLVWLPYNEQDAVIERHENDAMHRTIRSGSLLMHECCANFMHFNRQLNTERSRRNEDLRMTEILSGLGRGKSTPIGMDRDGSFYWVFKDCRALYVSTGGVSTLKSNASSGCSPKSSFDSGCSPKWSVYRREIDIGRVVNWLVDAVPEERLLKRILQLLFPNCCCSEDPQPPQQEQLFSSSIIDSSQRSNKSNNTTRSLESTGSAVSNVLELLRPDVSMRPAVVHRSRLLDLHYPSPSNETKLSGAPFKYRKGERILVDATPSNHILWDARVLETSIAKYDEDLRIRYYKVRFDQWGPAYDGWFEESQIVLATGSVTGAAKQKVSTKTIQAESRQQYLQEHVWSAPPTLQSLNAYRFMGEPGRANSYRPPLSFSDSKGMVSQLRLALLIVEAALPHGSIDDSDDRWGEDFVTPWRAAVTVANDAVSLMQCQIMLEFGIRTAWLRPTGLKMLSCLASRTHAMRTATCGMVAIRIWTLDAAIKYDKLAATNSSQLSLASNPSDGKGSKPTPRAKHAKRK